MAKKTLGGCYEPDKQLDEKKYKLLPEANGHRPKVGGLVFVHRHNHPDCVGGPYEVTHVGKNDYVTYKIPGKGPGELASTYRERVFVVEKRNNIRIAINGKNQVQAGKVSGYGLFDVENEVTEDFLRCVVVYCSESAEFELDGMKFKATCERVG